MRTQKGFLGVFYKSSCSALIKALMKYLNLISSGSKLKTVTCKFTKGCTLSELFFKEFHYKCRTLILKNASWWLLLRATLFWKYYWTTAFQRQLHIYFKNSRLQIFYISYFDIMLKRDKFLWIFLSKPSQKISEILPLHTGIIVVLSNK